MQSILSLANSLPVEVCVQTSPSDDSSPWILTFTLHSTAWSPWKHQVDCYTIFRGRVSKLSPKCFYQNRVPDTYFEAEVPPPHTLLPWTFGCFGGRHEQAPNAFPPPPRRRLVLRRSETSQHLPVRQVTYRVVLKLHLNPPNFRYVPIHKTTQLFLCSRRNITAAKPPTMSMNFLCINTAVI